MRVEQAKQMRKKVLEAKRKNRLQTAINDLIETGTTVIETDIPEYDKLIALGYELDTRPVIRKAGVAVFKLGDE